MASTEPLVFEAADESDTAALGQALAEALPLQAVVALIGPLGAGKTRLVQAVAAAAGVDPRDVISPTFVLIHEYQGRLPICHFDAYRLRDEDDFMQLGPDEYFERPGWTFIEWADRVERCLPRERMDIRIEPTSGTARRFSISAIGGDYQATTARLAARLTQS